MPNKETFEDLLQTMVSQKLEISYVIDIGCNVTVKVPKGKILTNVVGWTMHELHCVGLTGWHTYETEEFYFYVSIKYKEQLDKAVS